MTEKELNLRITDFNYNLPDERIAKYPLEQRDLSKLLVYNNGEIADDVFSNLAVHLPKESLLIYNETRVIQARLLFRKSTGSEIEIFCLEPIFPAEYNQMFQHNGPVIWKCLVGNNKKWKGEELLLSIHHEGSEFILKARKKAEHGTWFEIEFEWQPAAITFAQIIDLTGHTPIPPYLRRDSEEIDRTRYQTIFSQFNGSVAAPTAGLHFTPAIFEKLENNFIQYCGITLHVGAGTFKPVANDKISEHEMHSEAFFVNRETIYNVLEKGANVTSVGTTTLRALESLYWSGVKLLEKIDDPFVIRQWDWCNLPTTYSFRESISAMESYFDKNNVMEIMAKTSIMIVPGYDFKIVKRLITNFHQPKSTLILLVAAFVGEDWKKIYDHALRNGYRFLSYGDGSLLYRKF